MPKALAMSGLVVSALVLIIFLLDLLLGFPFSRVSATIDVGFIICSLILGPLSWFTYKELG